VTNDVAKAVEDIKGGKNRIRVDPGQPALRHRKTSFSEHQLLENYAPRSTRACARSRRPAKAVTSRRSRSRRRWAGHPGRPNKTRNLTGEEAAAAAASA